MAKIKRNCDNCRGPFDNNHKPIGYWTRLIRVYVLKEHQCGDPKCRGLLKPIENGYVCTKCKKVWDKKDSNIVTQIKGSSTKLKEIQKWKDENREIEKVNVPEKRFCQQCKNMASYMENMQRQRAKAIKGDLEPVTAEELSKIPEVPVKLSEIDRDMVKRIIQRKIQEEQRAEAEKKMKEKREAEIKASLLKRTSEELLKKEKKNVTEIPKKD
jgi:DNA-directed RNA polymerase subunit M/transcription elongation factor TFIIS